MGILSLFTKTPATFTLQRLPAGSFTVDRNGTVVSSTLPSDFPESLIREIAGPALESFRGAEAAQIPLSELHIYYPSLKITARELRGGAILFLSPESRYASQPN